MTVHNGTGTELDLVTPLDPTFTKSGTASATVGPPNPRRIINMVFGSDAHFRWRGQLSGNGGIRFTVGAHGEGSGQVAEARHVCDNFLASEAPPPTATAVPPTATPKPTRTPLPTRPPTATFTPTHTPTPRPFNPGGLTGLCTGVVSGDGIVSLHLRLKNDTGVDLTNLTPSGAQINVTGSVQLALTSGPQPGSLRMFRDAHTTRFKWQGQASGRGLGFIHVSATASGPEGQTVSSGLIECNTLVVPAGP
jgi:hypothetical protein